MGASIDEPQWDNRPILNSAHVVTQPERSAKIYADNVGSIGTFFIFSFSWEFHHPNWRTHIFQRGRHTTNQQILWQPNNIRSPRRTTTPQSKAPFGSPGWSAELITRLDVNWSETTAELRPEPSGRTPSQVVTKTRGGLRVPRWKKKLKSPPRSHSETKAFGCFLIVREKEQMFATNRQFFDFSGVSWMVVAYFTIGVPY